MEWKDQETIVEIAFRGMEASPAVEERIREKVERLKQFNDRIISCRVTIDEPHRKRQVGKVFHVKIEIGLPGRHDVVVNREPEENHAHEDIYVALRDAFDAARRRLQDAAAKMGGDVKTHRAG
jgi:ribosomal subunit interface protein